MASNKGDFVLDLHPLDGTDFIGTIRIEEVDESNSIETIIILDQSGSMKDQTRRFTNMIIPLVLSILSYGQCQQVHLITFARTSTYYYKTAAQLKSLDISSGGGTNLAPALDHVKRLLMKFEADQPIRILTISDGEINDADKCSIAMKEILEYLNRSHFSINSQAVRLFTSNNQPDTKALCNLTMLNNTTTSSLVDISCTEIDNVTARTIANLFLSDKFKCTKSLKMESKIVYKFPWDLEPASEIMLLPGLNLFWLKGVPATAKIRSALVKVNKQNQLTLTKFQELMEVKMEYFLDHMKILKVVGTAEANKSVDKILKYFENQEAALAKTCSNGEKHISMLLGDIARDENFKNLDSGRMAEYLKEVTKKQKDAAIQRQKNQEEQRKRQEIEDQRKKKEEEDRKRLELIEEQRKKEEEERIRQENQRKTEEEAERKRLELIEEQRKKEEEEERISQENQRKTEEEAERKRLELIEEQRKKEEEEERVRQENQRKTEDERKRKELIEEQRKKEDEEERIRQDNQRKKEEEEEALKSKELIEEQRKKEDKDNVINESLPPTFLERFIGFFGFSRKELVEEQCKKENEEEKIMQENQRKKEVEEELKRKELIEEQRKKEEEEQRNKRTFSKYFDRFIEIKLQSSSGTGCDL